MSLQANRSRTKELIVNDEGYLEAKTFAMSTETIISTEGLIGSGCMDRPKNDGISYDPTDV